MAANETYVLTYGDTLHDLAARRNLFSYKVISFHPDNQKLLSLRGSARKLQVGDKIVIPNDPIKAINSNIEIRQKLKERTIWHIKEMMIHVKEDYRQIKSKEKIIDDVAKVVLPTPGKVSTASKALVGARAAIKKTLKSQAASLTKAGLEYVASQEEMDLIKGDESPELLLAKKTYGAFKLYQEMESKIEAFTNPSYWSKRFFKFDVLSFSSWTQLFIGVDIDKCYTEQIVFLESSMLQTIKMEDARINQYKTLRSKLQERFKV